MAGLVVNILGKKCPRCRQSKLFTEPLVLTKPLEMPERCNVCGQNFNPEPGFYYGAMFISYILSSFFFLFIAGVTIIVFDWSVEAAFALIIFIAVILYIWVLRMSRSIWINLMVKYDPEAKNNYRESNFN